MAGPFPTSPSNLDTHTTDGGTTYQYLVDRDRWVLYKADVDLDDLSNVNTSGKGDGDTIVWDVGTSEWIPGEAGVGAHRLDEHTDPNTDVTMGTQKLTGLAAGTTAGDSVRYEQLHTEDHDNTHHTTNYHTETDGTGAVTVHSGVTDAGSGIIISDAERTALHPKDHDNTEHTTNYHTETDGTGTVTIHNNVTGAGSGIIISDAERTALHPKDHDNTEHTTNYLANLSEDSTPELGGDLYLLSNGIVRDFVATGSVIKGNLCYIAGSGEMVKTDADIELGATGSLGMATAAIGIGNTGKFLLWGNITGTYVTGTRYYISNTLGGIIAESSKPSGTGDIVRYVGIGLSTTILFFDPDKSWVKLN